VGGFGSTRWDGHRKKQTVEQCLDLGTNRLATVLHILAPGLWRSGSLQWGEANSIGYELDTTDMARPWLRLRYTLAKTDPLDYLVTLTTTRPAWGGLRWWFICPLTVAGAACGRRVGKLYLPPGGRYFGCRHCYRLTYRSAQTHDPRLSRLSRLDPAEIMDGMNRGTVSPVLALQALERQMARLRRWG